jgi:hypothetical protein
MSDAVQLVLSAAVGAVAGLLATYYKSRKDLESLYDIELRRKRIDAYGELWKLLEPLAYWSPPEPPTYRTLGSVSRALRSWYFTSGGLVLSTRTRAPYFNLQQALTELTGDDRATSDEPLDDDTKEIVKALASRLRSASTDDVATRVVPALSKRFGASVRALGRSAAPVRVEIDRRWNFKRSPPEPAFFVIVANVSGEELTVEDVDVAGGLPTPPGYAEELSFVLQPGEERELQAPVAAEDVRPGHTPPVTVTVRGRGSVTSTVRPPIPLRTPVLERPRPSSATNDGQ